MVRTEQPQTIRLDEPAQATVLPRDTAERAARLVHELRSPLATVSSALDILAEHLNRPPDPRVLEVAMRQIREGLRRVDQVMLVLTHDAERQVLDLREVDLGPFVRAQVDRLLPADRSVTVDVPEGLGVQADPKALEHILDNLVRNALQHAQDGPTVQVAAEPADGGVLLTVQDDGPGIPPKEREAMFAPFQRGGGSSGTGLGLTVVRRFVTALGGHVWLEDRPDGQRGARVCVWLPATVGQAAAP